MKDGQDIDTQRSPVSITGPRRDSVRESEPGVLSRLPQIPRLDLAARYVPSFELGGDFYDFIELNGHLGLVVGDVVGKGIAAALLMAAVRASRVAVSDRVPAGRTA